MSRRPNKPTLERDRDEAVKGSDSDIPLAVQQ
jgi:hypothetical protein